MAPASPASGSTANVPDPSSSVSDYLGYLQSQIQPLTRTAAQLPGPSDLSFHRSLDRSLLKELDATKEDIVGTLNSLLDSISVNGKGKAEKWDVKSEDLVDDTGFARKLGDVVDTLLEKAAIRLDEHEGKGTTSADAAKARGEKGRGAEKGGLGAAVGPLPSYLLNSNIQPLPQTKFAKKPDNSRNKLWSHGLESKPHAKVPLSWKPSPPGPEDRDAIVGVRQGMYCAEGDPRENPYYYEINSYAPPGHASEVAEQVEDLIQPPPLQKQDPTSGPVPFLWVDDEASFNALFDHLMEERVKEIAIDVEHHNYRSFQGLVCLVQVSTRWHDYIIDALSPKVRSLSSRLNQVFADEDKVKILHGAEHDILWLQRDLEVYIVGLFDTYHATNVLSFPQHSLAFLLSRYIKFEADKRYQLADWRIRPLNKEMMFYARSDTHSLIYIYDCLRFEIAKKEGLEGIKKVFELSKRTAGKVYAKEEWDPNGEGREGWKTQWKRVGGIEAVGVDERWEQGGLDGLGKTERIFRALHEWRDQVARTEDESVRYILPSNSLLNLSSRAPDTPDAVLSCVGTAFKKRVPNLTVLISRESDAFQTSQRERGEKERAKLKSKQGEQAGGFDEEMGEILDRGFNNSSSQTLWPADETSSLGQGPSTIATLLFPDGLGKHASGSQQKAAKSSLFAPRPKALGNHNVLTSIKSDLSSALRGILGRKKEQSRGEQEGEQNGGLNKPETVAFVAKEDRRSMVDTNVASSHVHDEQQEVAAPSPSEQEDTVVKVKKSKKRASDDQHAASSPKDKKPRWSKEEKEQRRKEKKGSSTAAEEVQPFDYSTAKSVLDTKAQMTTGSKIDGKKKQKKGMDKGAKEEKGKSSTGRGEEGKGGRYSSISVRRDRREQQGGKSMSFSH